MPASRRSDETADLLRRVVDALDAEAIGRIYCDEGGEAFWRDRKGPAIELGLRWARAARTRLRPGGRSLFVGAGVAELAAMLVERLELGREVMATNLRVEECDLLNEALGQHGAPLRLQCVDAASVEGTFDHVCLVSVLSDPETFPAVSGLTYGRLHPASLDLGGLAGECARVRGLVDSVLGRLESPGIVTTTVEEVPWILEWAEGRGVAVAADDTIVETAIVGDAIGFLGLERSPR